MTDPSTPEPPPGITAEEAATIRAAVAEAEGHTGGEIVALALASYQAGRGDLGAVLAARREAVETRLRLIDLDTQGAALRVRLSTLIAEQ